MDYNLLSIIKKEKEKLIEDKNDNYSRLSCDVHVIVENLVENAGFDDYSQNSILSNNQQETFNYDNIKEEKQSCYLSSENFINSRTNSSKSMYKCKKSMSKREREVFKKYLKYKTCSMENNRMLCDVCGKIFKSPRDFKQHKCSTTCQEGMTVQCPLCPKILNSKSSLMVHSTNCHSEGPFQCRICKSVFKRKQYLLTHMKRVHYDDGKVHHCDICGKSFKSPTEVRIHKKKVHQKSMTVMTVQCPKCPKIFSISYLKRHLENCHSEGTFQCKICNSVFKSESYLGTHMWRVHDDDGKVHRCDICGKSFKSPSNVRIHKKKVHQISMTVQCPKCPKILSKSYLTTHLKNCHSEGTFQCKICNSVFKSESYLGTHMWRVHDDDGKVHRCDICGKSFKSLRRVTMHKKSHSYLK